MKGYWAKVFTAFFIAVFVLAAAVYCHAGEKEELALKRELIIEKANRLQLQQTLIQRDFADLQGQLKDVDEKLKKYAPKKEEGKKK
jgi:hypothetical protein